MFNWYNNAVTIFNIVIFEKKIIKTYERFIILKIYETLLTIYTL